MTRHFQNLCGARVLETRHLLLTKRAVMDVLLAEAIGAVIGPAGLGKTFAIEHSLREVNCRVTKLRFESRPTMRLVADRLLHEFTGHPGRGSRFAMTQPLIKELGQRRCLIIIEEAQNLNRECFEFLRYLHDDESTHFGLVFDGGVGAWDVISREPMLESRIYRKVPFARLSEHDVLDLIPSYHPIYEGIDRELLLTIDDNATQGRLRSWAAFTRTAAEICRDTGHDRITAEISQSAMALLGSVT